MEKGLLDSNCSNIVDAVKINNIEVVSSDEVVNRTVLHHGMLCHK
jgi:hypothetical protein